MAGDPIYSMMREVEGMMSDCLLSRSPPEPLASPRYVGLALHGLMHYLSDWVCSQGLGVKLAGTCLYIISGTMNHWQLVSICVLQLQSTAKGISAYVPMLKKPHWGLQLLL